ncbi:MAG: lipocalin family protein [Betaproteobacteria bacterium]|nr:lipocalin family protein [Betaproteobacteria bacterium]
MRAVLILLTAILAGCTGKPEGVDPVRGFEVERYLGRWHEIARLDHSFERGLTDVTAVYTLRGDGGLDVVNRGFDAAKQEWREAKGRAYFLGDTSVASLKVTFFWPFYGGYHVIALDQAHYRYALVAGPSRDYLWILAREKALPEAVMKKLLDVAQANGFDVKALIRVTHRPY